MIDLAGPDVGGQRQRIISIIVMQGGNTWFFKMRGPAAGVSREQAAFETFVSSVRFGGP